jgi:hypothetical protein
VILGIFDRSPLNLILNMPLQRLWSRQHMCKTWTVLKPFYSWKANWTGGFSVETAIFHKSLTFSHKHYMAKTFVINKTRNLFTFLYKVNQDQCYSSKISMYLFLKELCEILNNRLYISSTLFWKINCTFCWYKWLKFMDIWP